MPSASVSFFPIPTAGTTEGTANFSIPADEYGYVQMSVTASSAASVRASSVTPENTLAQSADAAAQGGGQWLDEGDSVSIATAVASGGGTGANARLTSTSSADFLINGTIVKRARAHISSTTAANGAQDILLSGVADANYSISRFDK